MALFFGFDMYSPITFLFTPRTRRKRAIWWTAGGGMRRDAEGCGGMWRDV